MGTGNRMLGIAAQAGPASAHLAVAESAVAADTSLMTHAYPPFRLDAGGTDPATTVIEPTA